MLQVKPVPGFPGYFALKDGTLLRTITPSISVIDGYPKAKANMRDANVSRSITVARAVHAAWGPIQPSPDHTQVDHIDDNSLNNSADNLQWLTPQENSSKAAERCRKRVKRNRRSRAVQVTSLKTGEIFNLPSLHQVVLQLGLKKNAVQSLANGTSSSTQFKIEYTEEARAVPFADAHPIEGEECTPVKIDRCVGYWISDCGRVKKIGNRHGGRAVLVHDPVIYPCTARGKVEVQSERGRRIPTEQRGYFRIALYLTGEGKRQLHVPVHKLVASHFPKVKGAANEGVDGFEISHLDADGLNNHWTNLEVTLHSLNMQNPITIQRSQDTKKRKREFDEDD
jgi:hypothetical protein